MQPGVTAVLATVWLVAAAGVVGAVTLQPLRLSHDQYSPASPNHHWVQQEQTDWRDHDPVKDQPLDLRIGLRESISTKDSSGLSRDAERDSSVEEPLKDIALQKQIVPLSGWQKWLSNIGDGSKFAVEIDYEDMVETLPRKMPPSELDDPFVADDTFQDQGPGSVEVYKLDLSKENTLLTATTPSTRLPARNKSKAPKKTGRENSKSKTTEMKSTTSSNTLHRQSNFFEEQRTETPVNNYFGVGGVPELQVGCEGLAASSHKTKRSISTPGKEEGEESAAWLVTPITLDLDYGPSHYEDDYEMDELLKLKKLQESTTKKAKPKRGDMDATLHTDHLDKRPEKLPIRGDLGKSAAVNSSGLVGPPSRKLTGDSEVRDHEEVNAKRESVSSDDGTDRSRGRRLLWLAEANTEGFAAHERKRAKRSIEWGFGENEGVVSSNELQTVNQRRRQHEMRYHQDSKGHKQQQRGLDSDIHRIRQEYDWALERRQREEEERMRRMQQGRRPQNAREEEEERRREEMRRQYEEHRGRIDHASTPRTDYEDARRRQMEEERRQDTARNTMQERLRNEEERRRQKEEERKRLWEEERRRLRNEEVTRQEQYRSQQEAQRQKVKEMGQASREDPARNFSEEDKRKIEEHRREQMEKRRREDEKRRQQEQDRNEIPGNLMRAGHPNVVQYDRDQERRRQEQEERLREQKLQEYIARNRPINVNRMNTTRNDDEYRRRVEEQRRKQEEERRLQDYIRRNQPVDVSSRNEQPNNRNLLEERRLIEKARERSGYPDPGTTRRRGPSAPTNIDPRSSLEETRKRLEARRLQEERRLERERQQWYEAEERRKELARRQQHEEQERRRLLEERQREEVKREEEARREQSRRYEEERKRLEAAREAERKRQEILRQQGWSRGWTTERTRQPEATRSPYYDPRLEEHRRRQDSRPIPSNLVWDEARRAAERERQRQEQTRLEAERRRQEEESRRQKETNNDQWKRQEIVRLQALPVRAKIIVRPGSSTPSNTSTVISRIGSENEIEFAGINPNRQGVQVAQFPAPPTRRPPIRSPGPCVWAVVQCCSRNNSRLTKCFESMGCPGTNWDANPCRHPVMDAARREVMKFYAATENP